MLKDIPQTLAKCLINFKAYTTQHFTTRQRRSIFIPAILSLATTFQLFNTNTRRYITIGKCVTLLHVPKTIPSSQAAAAIHKHIQKPFYTLTCNHWCHCPSASEFRTTNREVHFGTRLCSSRPWGYVGLYMPENLPKEHVSSLLQERMYMVWYNV
jgi:hypothetical protein